MIAQVSSLGYVKIWNFISQIYLELFSWFWDSLPADLFDVFFCFAVLERQTPVCAEQVIVSISKFVKIQNSNNKATDRFRLELSQLFLKLIDVILIFDLNFGKNIDWYSCLADGFLKFCSKGQFLSQNEIKETSLTFSKGFPSTEGTKFSSWAIVKVCSLTIIFDVVILWAFQRFAKYIIVYIVPSTTNLESHEFRKIFNLTICKCTSNFLYSKIFYITTN